MPPPSNPYRPYLERFANPQGPGDQRPTAAEIIKDQNAAGKLEGKVILITGGTGGLGLETAKSLHLTGAKIFITARSEEKGRAAVEAISRDGVPAEFVVMDLASLESVRAAAEEFGRRSERLDILITNAGVMATPFTLTSSGHELQLGSNHLAHFLLFHLLQPLLSSSAHPSTPSRVIALSSAGHRFSNFDFSDPHCTLNPESYNPLKAYAQSKLANIWMCNAIDRRFHSTESPIRALSVHPGTILTTNIARHFEADTLASAGDMEHFNKTGCNVEQGAATTVWAALEGRFDAYGGVYLAEVGEGRVVEEGEPINVPAYAPYAYDEEGEERLWGWSLEAVSLDSRT